MKKTTRVHLFARSSLPLLLLLLSVHGASAAVDEHRLSVEPAPTQEYRYIVKLPEAYQSDTATAWPMILYVHGGKIPKFQDLGEKIGFLSDLPAIIVAPVCPPSAKGWQYTDWDPRALGAIVRQVGEQYRVDADRRSLIGFSMGGSAAWELPFHEQEMFARIVVIAGVCHPWSARNYPPAAQVWVFSGSKDSMFPEQQQSVVTAKRFGVDVVETIWPGMKHGGIYQKACASPSMLAWLSFKDGAARLATPPELEQDGL